MSNRPALIGALAETFAARAAALQAVGLPRSFDGQRPPWQRAASGLGEHNREILTEG